MKAYGLKRDWNATEDWGKWGRAYRKTTHSKITKMLHRQERRRNRQNYRKMIRDIDEN